MSVGFTHASTEESGDFGHPTRTEAISFICCHPADCLRASTHACSHGVLRSSKRVDFPYCEHFLSLCVCLLVPYSKSRSHGQSKFRSGEVDPTPWGQEKAIFLHTPDVRPFFSFSAMCYVLWYRCPWKVSCGPWAFSEVARSTVCDWFITAMLGLRVWVLHSPNVGSLHTV